MHVSAWQQIIMGMAVFAFTACSKVTVSKTSSSSSTSENDEGKAGTPADDKNIEPESEAVVPPNNISGTFLACALTRNPDPAVFQAVSTCALQDDTTRNKVDINSFRSHDWTLDVPAINSVTATLREMPANSNWHLEVQVKAATAAQLDIALQGTRVSINVRNRRGGMEAMSTPIMGTDEPKWLALNGNRLPNNAIPGGTEHMEKDILSICRVYVDGGVYPGKMQPYYDNPQKTVCYSSKDLQGIESMSDARTQTYNTDVLMPGSRPWAEILEWTTVLPGLPFPKNAFLGGVDELGESLYVCRGSESGPPLDPTDRPNSPTGEWTPGYVKASNNYCQHEYYGQRNSPSYQLLIWKTIAPQ